MNYAKNKPWNVVGYVLLAVALVLSSVTFTQEQNSQNRQIKHDALFSQQLSIQQSALAEQQRLLGLAQQRSCGAIIGASLFWQKQLVANNLALEDPFLSPVERKARLLAGAALREVIFQSQKVAAQC